MKALSKANQAQIKSKEATRKVEQAKKELEDIAAILATVQEPGRCTYDLAMPLELQLCLLIDRI